MSFRSSLQSHPVWVTLFIGFEKLKLATNNQFLGPHILPRNVSATTGLTLISSAIMARQTIQSRSAEVTDLI